MRTACCGASPRATCSGRTSRPVAPSIHTSIHTSIHSTLYSPLHSPLPQALLREVGTRAAREAEQALTAEVFRSCAPRVVPRLEGEKVVQLACGVAHTVALTAAGGVFAWGAPIELKAHGEGVGAMSSPSRARVEHWLISSRASRCLQATLRRSATAHADESPPAAHPTLEPRSPLRLSSSPPLPLSSPFVPRSSTLLPLLSSSPTSEGRRGEEKGGEGRRKEERRSGGEEERKRGAEERRMRACLAADGNRFEYALM